MNNTTKPINDTRQLCTLKYSCGRKEKVWVRRNDHHFEDMVNIARHVCSCHNVAVTLIAIIRPKASS